MFILQVPSVGGPAGPQVGPGPQANDDLDEFKKIADDALKTRPSGRSPNRSPSTGGNGTEGETFTPSNAAIDELIELLRSGVSPNSRAVKNFLSEKGLENDPEVKKIFEKRKHDRAKIRQLLVDGLTLEIEPELKTSEPVLKIIENSTLSEKDLKEIVEDAEEEKGELTMGWNYFGQQLKGFVPIWREYSAIRDIYKDYEHASDLPEGSKERRMAMAEANTNLGTTIAMAPFGMLMGGDITMGNRVHLRAKPVVKWITSWFE